MTPRRTRFTAVDEVADLMERRGEPNLIYLELAVAGRIDPDRLRSAVETAFAAHSATRASRAPGPPWRLRSHWQVGDAVPAQALTVVRPQDGGIDVDAERRSVLDTPVSLRSAPLLRLRLLSGAPGGDRLLLVAHHAGFDGMGFLGVLLAVCRAYDGATPTPAAHLGQEPAPATPPVATGRPAPTRLPGRAVRVARRPAAGRHRGYGLVPLRLDAPASAALAQAARRSGATLNDLLLASLALTVTHWNAQHGRPVAPLRITMPINMRGPQAKHEGEGNLSRLTSIDASGADPRPLLAAVATRTLQAKAAPPATPGGPAALVLGAPWLPRAVRRLLAPGVRFAGRALADTTMLSNLGAVTGLPSSLAGAGEVTELWAAAPAPMPRGLSLTALSVDGRLHLMIRHRFEALDRPAATAFTDMLAARLADLAEDPAHRPRALRQEGSPTP